MKNKMKLAAAGCSALVMLSAVPQLPAAAEGEAAEFTASAGMTASTGYNTYYLRDGSESSYLSFGAGSTLTIACDDIIAGISIKFQYPPAQWQASGNEMSLSLGQNGYQHDFGDVSSLGASTVTLTFQSDTAVAEVRVFGAGTLPEDVQVWEPAYEKADIALFATHNDDEHLFMLGLIPDAIARGKQIQVVYFTNHNGEPIRLHETLNALWKVGMRHYPAIGRFPDQYSETLDGAKWNLSYAGYSYDDVVAYQVEMLRRFKPDVVAGHDIYGEYGHGQHRLNSDTLMKAVELSGDPANYPASAELYGAWDVPKTYIHLYGQNQLVMNYDVPLDYYGGKTAYQVSLEGYACHNSQQYTWFTNWVKGYSSYPINASQITTYSPCLYGLYRSTVGLDTGINDMFEHIAAPFLLGDADGNGTVTAEDAQLVLQAVTAMLSGYSGGLRDSQRSAADVNADDKVTVDDAQWILMYFTMNSVSGLDASWEQVITGMEVLE